MNNKNIFITGANGGIGRALVSAFAKKKANIWACLRTYNADFEQYAATLARENGVIIKAVVCDITDFDAIKNIIMEIKKVSGGIDVLVNNAGILKEALLQMTSMSVARQLFEVNFFAPFYISQQVSKLMMRQKNGGAIINVSSVAAMDGVEGETIYGATKAALYAMTKSMAKELGRYNIRANCVAPGITQTSLITDMKSEVLEFEKETTYLKRLGQPQDIADVITFLASDDARYITGQILRVDGGKN